MEKFRMTVEKLNESGEWEKGDQIECEGIFAAIVTSRYDGGFSTTYYTCEIFPAEIPTLLLSDSINKVLRGEFDDE